MIFYTKKISILFYIFFLSSLSIFAQRDIYVSETPKNYDYNYSEFVSSVRFYPEDSEIDYPILELGSSRQLLLEFDDLEADNKHYFYKIIHCNYDWTPSEDIAPLDYIDGYQENRFYESSASFNTRVEYTHYFLRIPNEDVKFRFSGNYLLKVYLNDDEDDLVLTRRFVVFEPMMKAVPSVRRSAAPPNSRTHQELSLTVQHSGIYIPSPSTDVNVAVLQNGRWDNAISKIKPTFIREEAIVYDLQGQISFPGFKEFRPLDIRSFRHRGPQVETMEQLKNGFILNLFYDIPRTHSAYLFTHDINGKYIIASHDNPSSNDRSEYGLINFNFQSAELPKHDVYIMGAFSDFRAYPQYKMSYNKEKGMYKSSFLLKNGFYDYYYAAVDRTNGKMDIQMLEGSTFEAENDYLFFVYYRKYGSRYDQVVAYAKTSSNNR
jgi:hypothetical protein